MTTFDGRGLLTLLRAVGAGAAATEIRATLEHPDLVAAAVGLGLTPEDLLQGFTHDLDSPVPNATVRPIAAYCGELLRHRSEIESLAEVLEHSGPGMVRESLVRTTRWLPTGVEPGEIRLVLVPLGFDFRTDRGTVYLDPLSALEYGTEGIRDTLSHELHHVARYRLTGEELTLMRPDAVSVPDDLAGTLREWASWLEAEGIADCVWSMTQLETTALREAARVRRDQEERFGSILRGVFDGLRSHPADADRSALPELRANLRQLAHPVGHAMAMTIERELGHDTLIGCVGRPRRFVEEYNHAASRTSRVRFEVDRFGWDGPMRAG
ncbi:MAG TPA: DUF5700 domain-containing putative Zn-dependent protease [Thermoplasmata archaeon]|nr:DUF5700 domain-containing putative Zn-dependent protease [Thermoplasmata archaeon]